MHESIFTESDRLLTSRKRESPLSPDFRVAPFLGFTSANIFFSAGLSFRARVSVLFLHEMHETRQSNNIAVNKAFMFIVRFIFKKKAILLKEQPLNLKP
jgi:hypothetical protein